MQTYAQPDDEQHRRVNDETLRQQIRRRPDLLRRMLGMAESAESGALVRRLAALMGLIKE